MEGGCHAFAQKRRVIKADRIVGYEFMCGVARFIALPIAGSAQIAALPAPVTQGQGRGVGKRPLRQLAELL
jgi:hypothetical protein